jgi:hypothetical protein
MRFSFGKGAHLAAADLADAGFDEQIRDISDLFLFTG